jgi:membrane protease YdiL (CAAX protease family)
MGLRFAAELILAIFNLHGGILPDMVFLVVVLVIARGMGKDEIHRILAWRDVPFSVFAAVMVMFFGYEIIQSEISNMLQNLFPVPDGFFDGWFYDPDSVFLTIVSSALFPGFTEEVFFRGIIARRFFRSHSARKAILLSAALFGVFHLNPWQAVTAFCSGIFLGWIYRRYRSIWLCMFIHAYHNVLAIFMSLPYIRTENLYHREFWRHPVWFDLIGLLLFGLGLLTVIVLSKSNVKEKN